MAFPVIGGGLLTVSAGGLRSGGDLSCTHQANNDSQKNKRPILNYMCLCGFRQCVELNASSEVGMWHHGAVCARTIRYYMRRERQREREGGGGGERDRVSESVGHT